MPALVLEDFAQPSAVPDSPSHAPDLTEADRIAAYETGYQAGWDDAARAETTEQDRIGADFARSLQEISFTFHEARAHVIQSMHPLLEQLTGRLLPELLHDALGPTILEELRPLIDEAADAPIELVVAPASRAALEPHLAGAGSAAIELREEPSMAEGQAHLRIGKTERQIDLSGALDSIKAAFDALFEINERTLKHG